ncbi:MAG: uncharacterized protein JWR03_2751 [Cohnella sp.]|jgi:uncharacterized protein GlcG (DUF336 family)|nr:uncharacterized protein [Cohnella sp.]
MSLNEWVVKNMLQDALDKGAELGIPVSAAVTDAAGHLLGFSRHVQAEIVSITLAQDKAYTSAINRISTAELGKLCQPGAELYGLQNHLGGRLVIFGGGVPVRDDDGVMIGAIGVSGGTTEQDAACALHAITMRSKRG